MARALLEPDPRLGVQRNRPDPYDNVGCNLETTERKQRGSARNRGAVPTPQLPTICFCHTACALAAVATFIALTAAATLMAMMGRLLLMVVRAPLHVPSGSSSATYLQSSGQASERVRGEPSAYHSKINRCTCATRLRRHQSGQTRRRHCRDALSASKLCGGPWASMGTCIPAESAPPWRRCRLLVAKCKTEYFTAARDYRWPNGKKRQSCSGYSGGGSMANSMPQGRRGMCGAVLHKRLFHAARHRCGRGRTDQRSRAEAASPTYHRARRCSPARQRPAF